MKQHGLNIIFDCSSNEKRLLRTIHNCFSGLISYTLLLKTKRRWFFVFVLYYHFCSLLVWRLKLNVQIHFLIFFLINYLLLLLWFLHHGQQNLRKFYLEIIWKLIVGVSEFIFIYYKQTWAYQTKWTWVRISLHLLKIKPDLTSIQEDACSLSTTIYFPFLKNKDITNKISFIK